MASIELKIREILNEKEELPLACQELIDLWIKKRFNHKEQFVVVQFLLRAGYFSDIIQNLIQQLEENQHLAWAQFVELLKQMSLKPSIKEVLAIIKGVQEQNALSEIMKSHHADILSPFFTEARFAQSRQHQAQVESQKQALKEQMGFLRAQRRFDEEIQLIEKYKAIYPRDTDVQKEQKSLDALWARNLVSEKNAHYQSLPPNFDKKHNSELAKDQELLFLRSLEIAQKEPQKSYDLALTLSFIDAYKEAIEILQYAPESEDRDWLEIDLLIKARKFIDALDFTTLLELKYHSKPDASFAIIYHRARALKGLGQNHQAMDLLKQIIKLKPNYKNASVLLSSWSNEEGS